MIGVGPRLIGTPSWVDHIHITEDEETTNSWGETLLKHLVKLIHN